MTCKNNNQSFFLDPFPVALNDHDIAKLSFYLIDKRIILYRLEKYTKKNEQKGEIHLTIPIDQRDRPQ